MKQFLIILSLVGVSMSICFAQVSRGTAETNIHGKKIIIEYGRPELQGRDMLEKASVGIVWRMGADEATSLVSEGNLIFGKIQVQKGSYSLFAKKAGRNQWELIINSEAKVWGSRRNPEKDLLAIPLRSNVVSSNKEKFTILLNSTGQDSGTFSMVWGTKELSADFTVE